MRRRRVQIMAHLAGVAISTSTDYGIDADAKEAIALAVLAHASWRRSASNLPSATGARRATILGTWRRSAKGALRTPDRPEAYPTELHGRR